MWKDITANTKREKMKIKLNNKSLEVSGVRKCNWFTQIIGLMFSCREKANALLFSFNKPTRMAIHSCFVFFPFLAVWLDNKNKIMGMRKVKPFTLKVSSANPYYQLLEIPFNEKYKETLKFLEGKKP